MSIFSHFQQRFESTRQEELSLQEYLELCKEDRSAYASAASGHSAIGLFAFFVGIIAAGLTAYYSWRLVFMTFHNKPVWKEEHGDDHAHAHDDHASHAQIETHSEPGRGSAFRLVKISQGLLIIPLLRRNTGQAAQGIEAVIQKVRGIFRAGKAL